MNEFMEPEILLLLAVCAFGLAVSLFVVIRSSDFVQLVGGGYRERKAEALVRQFTRAIAVAENRIYVKSRQLEELSRRLSDSNLTLERMNNMKSKFLSMVVHDVRAPLAAIRGYSNLFSRAAEDEKHLKMTRNITAAVDRLNLLVSDLTDVAMIEAGKLTIERAEFVFGELLAELMPSMEISARGKGVVLKYDRVPPGAALYGDKFRISQVLQNLLGNAIKFTPPGGLVELSAKSEGRRFVVRVKDSGIGIHPSETKKIFDKFYQARYQKDEKLRKQGWGLGLSIAQEIITRHGGEIGALSPGLGKGTEFYFSVPVKA